jgi:hypothetical protein
MGSLLIGTLSFAIGAAAARAQATPPSTDIYFVPLRQQGTRLTLGPPVNITNRPGYDNQPSFTPDGRAVLYTSVRGDGQADIYRYDVRTKTTKRLTSTRESEYSPTVFNASRFSVVRVELDSTQRLWSFRLDGTDPRLVFTNLKPVGYHAWVDSNTVALFLLGRPNALVLADTRTGHADTVARDVGRSLVPLPKGSGFSFLQHGKDSSWVLTAVDVRKELNSQSFMLMPLVPMPPGAAYVAWLAPAVALTATGSRILLWRSATDRMHWTSVGDLSRYGLSHISRLALSPDHRWLAIVAEPAARVPHPSSHLR